jgi:NADPH-dependent curcumin reductase CurA
VFIIDLRVKTYFDPVLPGMIMPALGVGRVVSSRNEKLKQGDIVSGLLQWKKYLIVNGKFVKKVATGNRSEIELLSFLGPLGISGLTAFTGFHNIGLHSPFL